MKEELYKAVKLAEQHQWTRGYMTPAEVVLDKFFWQALGKSLEWGIVTEVKNRKCDECFGYGYTLGENGEEYDCYTCGNTGRIKSEEKILSPWKNNWKYHWHRFIDHLAQGGDAETFFNQLLTSK